MLNREFDIVRLVKRMRKFTLMKNIMLSKSQRKLIKYFKNNSIPWPDEEVEEDPGDEDEKGGDNILQTLACVRKMASQDHLSDVDYKVLKGIVGKKQLSKLLRPD